MNSPESQNSPTMHFGTDSPTVRPIRGRAGTGTVLDGTSPKMKSGPHRPPPRLSRRKVLLVGALLVLMRLSHRLLRWAAVRVDEIEGRRS